MEQFFTIIKLLRPYDVLETKKIYSTFKISLRIIPNYKNRNNYIYNKNLCNTENLEFQKLDCKIKKKIYQKPD